MKIQLLINALSLIFSLKAFSQVPDWSWEKAMVGTKDNRGLSVVVDHSGNVYSTGYFLGTVDFDPGPDTYNVTAVGSSLAPDIFISKLDDAGNFLWVKTIGGTTHGLGEGFAITVDSSGNI